MGSKAKRVYETPEEKALAEVAAEKWNHYQEVFVPLENHFMSEVEKQDSDAAYKHASGMAASAGSRNFDQANRQAASSLASRGLNPNSGAFNATQANLTADQGASTGTQMANAQTQQQTKFIGGLSNIAAMGRGQATEAQQGMASMASTANRLAAENAQSAHNSRAARNYAIGTAAGGLANAYDKPKPELPNSTRADASTTSPVDRHATTA